MLETTSERLSRARRPALRLAGQAPGRRLETLEAAGGRGSPFTTGILIGIGETRAERIDALLAIAASHAPHGHVQEVIVQNFRAKPGTRMAGRARAAARGAALDGRRRAARARRPTCTSSARRTSRTTTSRACSTPGSTTGAASRRSRSTTSTRRRRGPRSSACARPPRRAASARAAAAALPGVRRPRRALVRPGVRARRCAERPTPAASRARTAGPPASRPRPRVERRRPRSGYGGRATRSPLDAPAPSSPRTDATALLCGARRRARAVLAAADRAAPRA